MSTPAITPVPDPNNQTLQSLLLILSTGSQIAAQVGQQSGNSDVQEGGLIAAGLISIVGHAMEAYQSHTGQPMDLSLLHHIDLLPEDVSASSQSGVDPAK
jgi:hypothetical protein